MEAIKFYIPFGGFYCCNIYDAILDSVIDSEIEDGYIKEESDINYTHIHEAMSEHIFDVIIENIIDDLDLNIDSLGVTYDGLSSPKYYNFSTDKIMAVCSNEVYLAIYNKTINNDEFISYVNEASKSRDGFVSFYEGIEEIKEEPSIYLEYLFRWYVLNYQRDHIIEASCDNINEIIYNTL